MKRCLAIRGQSTMNFFHARLIRGFVLCCLTLLAAFPQPPQDRPQDRSQRPGDRPSPNRPGGDRPGPSRPNPPRPNPPRPNPPRPNPPRPRPPSRPNRPPQWGRPPQNRPSYQFRPTDRDFLRRHYFNNLRAINRARRPVFRVGGYFPVGDIGYLTAVPAGVYGRMPPPPPGYRMGYFYGYVVVYDPVTYFIANLVDLLQ
jgi:hypothetical protein